MERARAHVLVEGRVQGVWFRGSTQDVARQLGLAGWVKNLPTGEVEAVFEGPRADVEEAVGFCRNGPPGALVTRCDVQWEPPRGETMPFQIRHQ